MRSSLASVASLASTFSAAQTAIRTGHHGVAFRARMAMLGQGSSTDLGTYSAVAQVRAAARVGQRQELARAIAASGTHAGQRVGLAI